MTADTTATVVATPEAAGNGRPVPHDAGAEPTALQQRLVLIDAALAELTAHLDLDRTTNIGFPSTFDIDYTRLWPMFNYVLNNVGDPFRPSAYPANTKSFEREVIHTFADLLRLPGDDRWGYVTTGGTEGTEWGLLMARTLYPNAVTFYSASSHYSVPKLTLKLAMPSIAIRTDARGQLDYDDLNAVLCQHRDRPVIVLASIGTTMTEAIDDVARIRAILAEVPIRRTYIHADAALSGLPLALLPPDRRPSFDLADGADSLSISGHKFLGSPFPCGVVLARASLRNRISNQVDYIATDDTTLGGSRNGHAALIMWYALTLHGTDGLRRRADAARELAAYTVDQLARIRWPAWRFPHALTVVLDTPPVDVAKKWRLATSGAHSHVIVLPGTSAAQIDRLVADLAASREPPPNDAPEAAPLAPTPRASPPMPTDPLPTDHRVAAVGI
jgi:histidine decarboxylase